MPSAAPRLSFHAAALCAAALLIWAIFQHAGLDRTLTAPFFDAARGGFWLKDAWWLTVVGHEGFKHAVLLFWALLLVAGFTSIERISRWRGVARHAAAGMALAAITVSLLKQWSAHSCPWDLVDYGGRAEWFPLFGELPGQPGPGRCLPAGHPVAGFSLFAVYFALRGGWPRAGRIALAAAVALGLAASAVQVVRGAHFASHTLWTAWIAWVVNLGYAALRSRYPGR